MKNYNELISAAQQVVLPTNILSNTSKMSFGIVNSKNNGRRLSFSKQLSKNLGLRNRGTVYLVPIASEGIVMIGTKLPFDNAYIGTVAESDERFTSYCAEAVVGITKIFSLPFGKRKSLSFNRIKMDITTDGIPVALVEMTNDYICQLQSSAIVKTEVTSETDACNDVENETENEAVEDYNDEDVFEDIFETADDEE